MLFGILVHDPFDPCILFDFGEQHHLFAVMMANHKQVPCVTVPQEVRDICGLQFRRLEVHAVVTANNDIVHERHVGSKLDKWVITLLLQPFAITGEHSTAINIIGRLAYFARPTRCGEQTHWTTGLRCHVGCSVRRESQYGANKETCENDDKNRDDDGDPYEVVS